jgi:hypothetical protein
MLPVLLLACDGPASTDPGTDSADTPPTVGLVITPVQTWSAHVESVALVSWTAPEGATSWVEFGTDGALDRRTPTTSERDVAWPLLGLAAARTWRWRAVSETADGLAEAEGELTVPDAPVGLPRLVVSTPAPGSEVAGGYVLSTVTTSLGGADADAYVAIWDATGAPVWWRHHAPGHVTVTPSLGTTPGTIWWDDYDLTSAALTSTAVRARLDGSEVLEIPTAVGHHAVIEAEPGVIGWAARDTRRGGDPEAWITADRVYEAPIASASTPREVVNLHDDLFGGATTAPCTHALTPWPYDGQFPVFEWSHLNSLVHLADRDAWLLHLRWVDTVLLVDRPTGEILWVMGGPDGTFTWADGAPLWSGVEDSWLSHAHLSDAWDGGLVAFDNGSHRSPPTSSIVELAWDEGSGTVEEVFRWSHPDGRFVGIIGDVRKLPGGSYLASWSTAGDLDEISPAGEVLWHAETEPPRSVGRVVFLRDLYDPTGR